MKYKNINRNLESHGCPAFILAVIFLLTAFVAHGQTIGNNLSLPAVAQPAPQSASLGRYGEIPVSVHTGVPNISIPICTVSSGKLSVPLSISYHASGVKVMDMASSTGMGWALNSGGDITRVVQGVPDESTYGFPTIRMPDINDPSLAAKEKCLSNNICNTFSGGVNTWDGQPDLFYYNLGSRSGQFMEKNMISGAQQLGFMTTPYTPIQISAPATLTSFQITDEDGTQYFFAPCDSSTLSTNTSARNQVYTTAWHVVKIRSAEKTDSITFKYGTISYVAYSTSPSRALQLKYDAYGNPHMFAWSTPSINNINTKEYLLSEIDFNNGKLTLDYGAGYAAGQTMILNAIHLYNLQSGAYNELKRFTFYHSAFMNGSVSTNVSRLDSLQVSGYYNSANPVKEPVYAFNYYSYLGWQIPPFNNYAQDFWGYFNGKTTNADMVFVGQGADATGTPIPVSNAYKRIPDSNYLKVGTLQSIKYPAGGNTVFDLEPNQTTTQVVKLDSTHHYSSINAYISTFGVLPNDASTFSYTFTASANYAATYINGGTSPNSNAKLTFEVSPYCTNGSTNCVYNQAFVQINDITSGSPGSIVAQLNVANPTTTTTQTALFNLVQGHTYKLYFPYQPVAPNGSSNFQNRLDANVTAQTKDSITVVAEPPVAETVLTGGLRIRKITSNDQSGNTLMKQYKYTGSYFNSSLFNGNFDQLAVTSYAFDGWNILTAFLGTASTPEGSTAFGRVITSYTSNLPLPLGGESNNAVSYNEVEEYESDGHGNYNGKTVYDYGDELQDIITMQMPFFKISKEDQRSLLTEKRTYKNLNGSYFLLQDVVNNYTDLDSGMTNADTVVFYTAHALIDQASLPETIGTLNGGASEGCLACAMFDNVTKFLTSRYYYTTSRLVLNNTVVTNYESSGSALATTTAYSYQNPVHSFPTHTHTVNSAGKSIDTYAKYVPDQTFTAGCSSSCTGNLQQQLAVVKQKYFPSFSAQNIIYGNDWYQMIYYYIQMGLTPADQPIYQNYANAIIAAENTFQQTQTHYQSSIDSLMNIYNTCSSNYNNCVASYYTTAPANQKAIMDMQAQNNIIPHLEDSTYTNNVLMSRLQNNYLTFLPNVTLPSTVQFAILGNALENRLQFNKYDIHGDILQQQKTGGPAFAYQWGYNAQYPVAQASNAASNDIFYDSFEEGDGNSVAGTAKTGHYSHTGGYSKLLTGLDAGNYTLSYWLLSGSTWSLVTTNLTGVGTSYTISIAAGQVDDIRFYPAGAQMTTYTYDPLIGMTSSTDAKNETTYYEYDGLQRLMNVKDKNGNIIKHTDYHYQGQ